MSKLFIFGIGGTGARVIKSLTMLLAAGVELKDSNGDEISKVIPIIIDPDSSNGDLTRTSTILQRYQAIRKKLNFEKSQFNNFFKTEITSLSDLSENPNEESKTVADHFTFHLQGVANQKFEKYINATALGKANKALIEVLFSKENLNADMELGFKGNPNLGSVVLNQFKDSIEFKQFASRYETGDKIFIISSIFGGTGAAGFPLLVKNIRTAEDPLPNHSLLRQAVIGAITVLPYFGVETNPNSKIDKATFISKTKAALSYYSRNLSGNKSLNALYYIGDDITKDYENHEGSSEQKNKAHFIEFVSALSVIDFIQTEGLKTSEVTDTTDGISTVEGKASQPFYKEYGINEDKPVLNYTHLSDQTQILVFKPVTQYKLFQLYLDMQLSASLNKQPWSKKGKINITNSFLTSSDKDKFYPFLEKFNAYFAEWIDELSNNERTFMPFRKDVYGANLFKILNDIEAKKYPFNTRGENFAFFDDRLNAAERIVGDVPAEQKFMSMFYLATQDIMNKKY